MLAVDVFATAAAAVAAAAGAGAAVAAAAAATTALGEGEAAFCPGEAEAGWDGAESFWISIARDCRLADSF